MGGVPDTCKEIDLGQNVNKQHTLTYSSKDIFLRVAYFKTIFPKFPPIFVIFAHTSQGEKQ